MLQGSSASKLHEDEWLGLRTCDVDGWSVASGFVVTGKNLRWLRFTIQTWFNRSAFLGISMTINQLPHDLGWWLGSEPGHMWLQYLIWSGNLIATEPCSWGPKTMWNYTNPNYLLFNPQHACCCTRWTMHCGQKDTSNTKPRIKRAMLRAIAIASNIVALGLQARKKVHWSAYGDDLFMLS